MWGHSAYRINERLQKDYCIFKTWRKCCLSLSTVTENHCQVLFFFFPHLNLFGSFKSISLSLCTCTECAGSGGLCFLLMGRIKIKGWTHTLIQRGKIEAACVHWKCCIWWVTSENYSLLLQLLSILNIIVSKREGRWEGDREGKACGRE